MAGPVSCSLGVALCPLPSPPPPVPLPPPPRHVWSAVVLVCVAQLLSLTHNNTGLLRVIGELTATQMKLERELNAQV